MALRLVVGPSGSGKTHFLFEYALKEADVHPDMNYLIIVPEQFTLSTQRELICLSKKHGILNVDVLSFNRLAYRIFEEVGFKDLRGSALDDMGKNLILMHVASKISDELTVFAGNIGKLGYITEIKSEISELMQYGISTDKLNEMIKLSENRGKNLLVGKLNDISKLYTAFNEYIRDKYITTEEVLTKAATAAYRSEKLKKSVVLFDGFTGFTPVQYSFIEVLLKITQDMYFTILSDPRDNYEYNNEHELFNLGFNTKRKLYALANKNNIRIDNEYIIRDEIPKRFLIGNGLNNDSNISDSRLVYLERNIFRDRSVKPINYTGDTEKSTRTVKNDICLFSGLNPMDEVIKVAVEIQKLIRNNTRIRYKDIAIATADIESYIPQFKRIFKLYNIPYFIDRSQPVLLNPFIEFVRSLIDIISDDFSYNSVFKLLRSPIMAFDKSDIDLLDNFILARGIKGYKAWNTSFVEKYGCNSKISKDFDLIALDIIRGKVLDTLKFMTDLITSGNKKRDKKPTVSVNDANQALISTFEMIGVESVLNGMVDEYSITDDTFIDNHCYEYENIYKNTIVLLNRISELLGDEFITIKEYGDLLNAGFDEIRIGIIPKITDYIQIGDTTRSRFNDIQVLFIVGANDGNIPGNISSAGIISDMEKEFLLEEVPGIELAPTARTKAYTCQLYLYMLMSKPRNRLYISYSQLNNESESIRPSYIIKTVLDMFPDISVEMSDKTPYDSIYNKDSMYNVLADNIRDAEFSWLINLILNDSDNPDDPDIDKQKLQKLIESAFITGVFKSNDVISKAVAGVLYGKALVSSITRLEEYAKCAFRFYLEYGLSLKEREIFSFDNRDMGTVFHSALENYALLLKEDGIEWTDVSSDMRQSLIRKAVQKSIDDELGDVLNSTFRNKYMLERMTKIVDKSVEIMTKQLEAGNFKPDRYELIFSSTDNIDSCTFKLSDDEIMRISGKVDRLDTYETDEKFYIKVIDYKSGDVKLDLLEIYKGRQLQLVVYLNACKDVISKETNKEIIPAGILYYHLDDPVIDGSVFMDEDKISGDIYKLFKMKGLVNNQKDIYRLMDGKFTGKSDIIPIELTNNDVVSKRSSAVSTDDFNIISQYVNKKICEMGKEILSGNIKAGDKSGNKADTCKYCPYTELCKYYMYNSHDNEGDDGISYSGTSGESNVVDTSNAGQGVVVTKDNVLEIMRKEVENGRH